jgi:hypothetical protein
MSLAHPAISMIKNMCVTEGLLYGTQGKRKEKRMTEHQ